MWEEPDDAEEMKQLEIQILDKRLTHPAFPNRVTVVLFDCLGVRYGYYKEDGDAYFECGLPNSVQTVKDWANAWIKVSGKANCPDVFKRELGIN